MDNRISVIHIHYINAPPYIEYLYHGVAYHVAYGVTCTYVLPPYGVAYVMVCVRWYTQGDDI